MLQVTGSLDQRIGGAAGNLGDDNYSRRTLYGKIDRKTLSEIAISHPQVFDEIVAAAASAA